MNSQKRNEERPVGYQRIGQQAEVEADPRGTKLIDYHEVETTPFTIGEYEGKFYILLGQTRISEEVYENLEEAQGEAEKITWNKIFQLIGITIEKIATLNSK